MGTKQQLAELLEQSGEQYISGNEVAQSLGITRAAVWKNIKQLQEDGYSIEAVRNKGYRLGKANDVVSSHVIREYLKEYADLFSIDIYDRISSTNTILKEQAAQLPAWHTVIAASQSAGKGRRTRSFYSPPGTGLYLSMLLRMDLQAWEATRITTAAAVAACDAIEECTDAKPSIKWVNDVYLNQRKICGILTEASISMESGGLDWAVMGIGFNVYEPEGGFPEEIRDIAGFISETKKKDLRSQLAAAFMKHFYRICQDLTGDALVREYRERSFLIGKEINVLRGEQSIPAVAEEIDDDCGLIVRYADGSRETLTSGEVSIRLPR